MWKQRITLIFLICLSALALFGCYLITQPFLTSIVAAGVIAIVFYPLHCRLLSSIRRPTLAALLSTLLVMLLVVLPAVLIAITVTREVQDLYRMLAQKSAGEGGWAPYLTHLANIPLDWARRYVNLPDFDLRAALLSRLERISATLLSALAGSLGNIASLVIDSTVTFFTLFFFFREGRAISRQVAQLMPLRRDQTNLLFQGINDTIKANVNGVLAVGAVQGMLTAIAFAFLGLPSPVLWGLVTALFSLIPLIGSAAVWAPAAIWLLTTGEVGKGVMMLAWGGGVVAMSDNFVRPYVISGQVKMHTLAVFFALLGGAQAFGFLGLFLGPIILSVTQVLFELLRQESRTWQEQLETP